MTSSSKSRGRLLPALLVAVVVLPLVFALGSARAAPTELFFSEYIEGSSNNKALEIYNGTGAPIDLAANNYAVQMCFNGSTACTLTIPLVGTVAAGDVFVLAQSAASAPILAQADQTNGSGWFNGDDVVVLRKGATLIDVIGQLGFDPGTEWGTGLTSTADNTLRRKASIEAGDSNPSDSFDPAVEWDGFATDDFTGLGAHSTVVADAAPQVVTTTTPAATTRRASPSTPTVTVTFSEPVSRDRLLVLDLLHAERRAHCRCERRADDLHACTRTSTSSAAEACTVTIARRAGRGPRRRRPARHDGGELLLVVHDTGPAHPRDPGRRRTGRRSTGFAASDVPGIVTALVSNGFFFEDPNADGDPATSRGLFVFTSSAPPAAVGDAVLVDGLVTEFRPGGATGNNLSQTEITSPVVERPLERQRRSPARASSARAGAYRPSEVIDNDSTGDAEIERRLRPGRRTASTSTRASSRCACR